MSHEGVVDFLFRAAGIALVIIFLENMIGFFDVSILNHLPGPLMTFTYFGGVVGAIDEVVYQIFKVRLRETDFLE